jgi:hypothetical protein
MGSMRSKSKISWLFSSFLMYFLTINERESAFTNSVLQQWLGMSASLKKKNGCPYGQPENMNGKLVINKS